MQKTKSFVGITYILIAILVAFMYISCNDSGLKTGTLQINLPEGQSKSIIPGQSLRSVSAIQISGTGPKDAVLSAQNFRLGGSISVTGLSAGTWDISVTGYNGTETDLGTPLTAASVQEVTIQSGKTTSATYNLHYLTAGTGGAAVTVTWPSTNSTISSVLGTVDTKTENQPTASDSSFATTDSTTTAELAFGSTIAVGNYDFDLILTNASGTTISFPMIDMVNVFDKLTSTGTIALETADVPHVSTPVVTASVQSTTQQEEENKRTVTITASTPGATVFYYLLDGSESGDFDFTKKIAYTGPFDITVPDSSDSITKYVRAVAVEDGYQDSVPASLEVAVNGAGGGTVDVTKPTLVSNLAVTRTNDSATSPSFAVSYSIQGNLSIDSFAWYVDGVAATDSDADSDGNTFTYGGTLDAGQHQVTVKLGYKDGESTESVSGSLRFTITTAVATPTIATENVAGGVLITLSCASKGAAIHYTTDGSTDPTSSSTLYSGPFVLTSTATVKAIGILDGSGNSAVLTSSEISVGQANAPTFSVTAGTYEGKKTVEITAATGDAIHYTTDGSDPTVQSAVYDGAITVAETTTLKAIAVAQGKAVSAVTGARYTITYKVGDTGPAGGIVFLVDGNTYYEAAPANETSVVWATKSGSAVTVGDTELGIGTGEANTVQMVKKSDAGAAMECTAKSFGGYCDWYLPSLDELQEMRTSGKVTLSEIFWSSSESNTTNAWAVDASGNAVSTSKGTSCAVRAIRSFN